VRRAILILTLPALLVAGESRASAGGLDVRIGAFFPRGNESLFQDLNSLYTPNANAAVGVKAKDFNGVFGGVEYSVVVAPNIEVGFHLDGYGRQVETSYRDYTRPSGDEIRQTLKLDMVPVGVTVRLVPTGKRSRIAPYVGGGVDAIFYRYEEHGDFIDFFDPSNPIIADRFKDSSTMFGVHAVAGVRVYINRDFAIVAEGRYQWAQKDMGQDFAPNESGLPNRLDLTGAAAVVGLHVRF
jgi:opacity protein-like surface antigen